MKKTLLLTFTILLIHSCSSEDDIPINAPATPENFGDWTPTFTNQTSNFSQTSTGNQGTKKTRNITVTSSEETEEDNERTPEFNLDLNDDGDFVDYVERTITTYTASEGLGTFDVISDWSISIDQESNFGSLNYGNWGATISDDDGIYLYDLLLTLLDTVAESSSGTRDTDLEENCFGMQTLQEVIDEIPFLDYDILEDTDIRVSVAMYDIDLGEWIDDEEYDGIYVDYILDWSTEDLAGNDSITLFEGIYLAFTDYGVYNSTTIVTSLTGELGRLSNEEIDNLEWTVCSEESGKNYHSGKSTTEYLLNKIKNTDLKIGKLQ